MRRYVLIAVLLVAVLVLGGAQAMAVLGQQALPDVLQNSDQCKVLAQKLQKDTGADLKRDQDIAQQTLGGDGSGWSSKINDVLHYSRPGQPTTIHVPAAGFGLLIVNNTIITTSISTDTADFYCEFMGKGGQPVPTTPPTTATPTAPVNTATPTRTPVSAAPPTQIPTVPPTPVPQVGLACPKHGQIAWQNDNVNPSYEPSPVNGMNEPCWVVLQTWQDNPQVRYLVAIRPFSVAWLQNHKGGTGWFFNGSDEDVKANLGGQGTELDVRDGKETTFTLILPDDEAKFKRLVFKTATGSQFEAGKKITSVAQVCVGPAILEYGEPGTGIPVIRKLNAGEQSPKLAGGCFPFSDQAALDARWPAHVNEFRAKYGNAKVIDGGGSSAPTATPLAGQPTPSSGGATPVPAVAGKCDGTTATGPAIVEYGPPATVVKVNAGSTSPINKGGCFPFSSQSELDARWPTHKSEFLAKYADGKVVER